MVLSFECFIYTHIPLQVLRLKARTKAWESVKKITCERPLTTQHGPRTYMRLKVGLSTALEIVFFSAKYLSKISLLTFRGASFRSVWVKNAEEAKWKSNWPYKHLVVCVNRVVILGRAIQESLYKLPIFWVGIKQSLWWICGDFPLIVALFGSVLYWPLQSVPIWWLSALVVPLVWNMVK